MHRRLLTIFALCTSILVILPFQLVRAQQVSGPRPIDMFLVVDNSCSMFPIDQIVPGCDAWGSDPAFLRITGADLFVARMGFGEVNEDEYQLGVISMGEAPVLVNELQSLKGQRDELANKLANPMAQKSTQLIAALEMAYHEMHTSPNRDATHLPAVVLITDGVPYPVEGQSSQDITNLVGANPDIPLFIMLLQNKANPSPEYESYIQYWQQLQTDFDHLFVYRIQQAEEIEETYNAILSQLQRTIPTESVPLTDANSLSFPVGEYIHKVLITIIQDPTQPPGAITILDPEGVAVTADEPGVNVFNGTFNPVQVIAIGEPRLSEALRGGLWTISSTTKVNVLIDRQGGYRINFLSPASGATEIADVFQAVEQQTLNENLVVRFNLLNWDGEPVMQPQAIRSALTVPDGTEQPLTTTESLVPDAEGVYEIRLDLADLYPPVSDAAGRFTLAIQAGIVDAESANPQPVATARLSIDAGRMPYIRSLVPATIQCAAGQPSDLRVAVGDYDIALPDTLLVTVSDGERELNMPMTTPGTFETDLSEWCGGYLNAQQCSQSDTHSLIVRMEYRLEGTEFSVPMMLPLDMQVLAPECTPTPEPTSTPTPTPSPTPIPDSDWDGLNNVEDRCPSIPGLRDESGCVPTDLTAIAVGLLGIVVVTRGWGWPWLRVRTVGIPPEGYVVVHVEGQPPVGPISLYEIGMKRRISRVAIGGSKRKAHLVVPGLAPVEIIAERKSIISLLRDPQQTEPFAYLDDQVQTVRTSDPRITLKISLDRGKLVE